MAFDAVNMPMTRPRFCVNQRVATVAPRTIAVMPVPQPTMIPQNSVSCHTLFTPSDRLNPPTISTRAADTTRFRPYFIISAAANGAISPSRTSRTARAPEMSWAVQWNSFSSAGIRTPGAPNAQAVVSMVKKVTAIITQP